MRMGPVETVPAARIRAAIRLLIVATAHRVLAEGAVASCRPATRRLGIALLWPVSNQRYFAPWRPIPVAPIGARMLTMAGVRVVMTEALQFAPLLVWSLWPRRRSVA